MLGVSFTVVQAVAVLPRARIYLTGIDGDRPEAELLLRREGATVERWFEALPDDGVGSRRLLLARARVELYRGRVAEAEVWRMIRDGEILDSKSIVGILYVAGFKMGL